MFAAKIRIERDDPVVPRLIKLSAWMEWKNIHPLKVEYKTSLTRGITIIIVLSAKASAMALAEAFEGTWMGLADNLPIIDEEEPA